MTLDRDVETRLATYTNEDLSKLKVSDSQYRVSRTEALPKVAQPYLVQVTNISGVDLNGTVAYILSSDQGNPVSESGQVPDQANTDFHLGGDSGCSLILGYRLVLDDGNQIVADTGAVQAHQNPNAYWAVSIGHGDTVLRDHLIEDLDRLLPA
jgi:hypothetical protein